MKIIFIILILFIINISGKDIYNGVGNATFYYNINKKDKCAKKMGINEYPELNGIPKCETYNTSNKQYTLQERNTNYIIAIPNKMLNNNKKRNKYCGKELIIKVNNINLKKKMFVWDGCERCNEDGGIDLSSYIFSLISKDKYCYNGILNNIKWEITDNQILNFIE